MLQVPDTPDHLGDGGDGALLKDNRRKSTFTFQGTKQLWQERQLALE